MLSAVSPGLEHFPERIRSLGVSTVLFAIRCSSGDPYRVRNALADGSRDVDIEGAGPSFEVSIDYECGAYRRHRQILSSRLHWSGLHGTQHICYALAMSTKPPTNSSYEQYRSLRLADPEFRSHYERHRTEIDAVDRVVADIEARRVELGITKANLARLVGQRPESVRRLLSGNLVNPTLTTVSAMATALGMEMVVRPTTSVETLVPQTQGRSRTLVGDSD